jgi:hypothetical protein
VTSKLPFEQWLKLLGVVGALSSFLWGVWVWRAEQETGRTQALAEAARVGETRRIEATRPFLEYQLRLYTEVTQVAARLATSTDFSKPPETDADRFWQLYWGGWSPGVKPLASCLSPTSRNPSNSEGWRDYAPH